MQYLADGAMCSCYTAQLAGHGTVVVKKPSRRSSEVGPVAFWWGHAVGVRLRDVPCVVAPHAPPGPLVCISFRDTAFIVPWQVDVCHVYMQQQ